MAVLVMFGGVTLTACGGGGETDTDDAPAPPAAATPAPAATSAAQLPEGVTQAMVDEGRALFNGAGTCFACHGNDAVGTTLGPNLTDSEWLQIDGSYDAIIQQIKTGTDQPKQFPGIMLPRAGTNITDDQVNALAAYIYSMSH